MHRDAVELAHDNRRGRCLDILHWRRRFQIRLEGNSHKRVVKLFERFLHPVVMPAHRLAKQNKSQGHDNRQPAAIEEFRRHRDAQNRAGAK